MKWSKEEIDILKKYYPLFLQEEISKEDLQKIFKKRTWYAIWNKASQLKLTCREPQKIKNSIDYEYLKSLEKRIKI